MSPKQPDFKKVPLEETLNESKIKNIIDSIEDLPAIPDTFVNMREVIDDQKSSTRDLSSAIEKDQALTTKILKVANSAYYGFSRNISTINDSIVLMGFQKTWHIGMSISMMNLFSSDSNIFDRDLFWEHSLKVGVCSQIISRICRYPKPQELYTIGLLHDLGKLVLDQYFHSQFIEIIKKAQENKISFIEAETEVMGTNHAMIGSWLVGRWKLPDFFLDAIKNHHNYFADSTSKIALIVSLADTICIEKGYGFNTSQDNLEEVKNTIIEKLKLDGNLISKIEAHFADAAKRISLKQS